MADRTSLGIVGFIFGGITAAVIAMAASVVVGHIAGGGRAIADTAPIAFEIPADPFR